MNTKANVYAILMFAILVAIIAVGIVFGAFYTIDAGERGVLLTF